VRLADLSGFAFDLDGCVWTGAVLLPGAAELLTALRRRDKRVVFLTNNSRELPESVARKLSGLGVEASPPEVLTALDLLGGVDLLLDGTDNMETRLLVNDASLKANVPWVYAGAVATQGMVMPIVPGRTACFRCLVSKVPGPGTLPTCDTAGILNSVSTAVAAFQVTEGLKILLGEQARGDLLVYEGWSQELQRLRLARRKDCPACGRGAYEFLDAKGRDIVVGLCGRNAMSVDPLRKEPVSLEGVAARLGGVGKIRTADQILIAEVEKYSITLFPDGRAVIKGTDDPAVARSVYARYLGS